MIDQLMFRGAIRVKKISVFSYAIMRTSRHLCACDFVDSLYLAIAISWLERWRGFVSPRLLTLFVSLVAIGSPTASPAWDEATSLANLSLFAQKESNVPTKAAAPAAHEAMTIVTAPIEVEGEVLSLHLSCEKAGCVTLEKTDGRVAIVQADSSLVLNADTILKAYINADSNLTVELSEPASILLGKITAENIGKQLAIVLDETVIAYPTITAPIYSGRIEIAVDRPTQPPYWEAIPWLFKKIYPDQEVPMRYPGVKKLVRLGVVILPLVIALIVIVIRRRRKDLSREN